MSGVVIARAILMAHTGTTNIVPSTKIIGGVLPMNTPVPCIGITSVSSIDRQTLAAQSQVKVTERVQITVMTETYTKCRELMLQVRKACRDKTGVYGGFSRVTCRLAGKGPDFDNEAGLAMQTQDLLITFNEQAS